MNLIDLEIPGKLAQIRKNSPLIHNITNLVVMDFNANALLAMGASPVMAHALEEVEEMCSLASALVLNIGTLSESWIKSMVLAAEKAASLKKPIIFDPVGSGATTFRTQTAKELSSKIPISVIRGNASEILSLRTPGAHSKGVDSVHSVEDASGIAKDLALELNTTIAITGKVDLITDGKRVLKVKNGNGMLPMITGSGCTVTTLIGAFLTVDPDPLTAAASALSFFGLAGEMAAEKAAAPGSFKVALLDAIYDLSLNGQSGNYKIFAE